MIDGFPARKRMVAGIWIETSCLKETAKPCADKIRAVYPEIGWEIQLDYGAGLGMGSRAYELVEI